MGFQPGGLVEAVRNQLHSQPEILRPQDINRHAPLALIIALMSTGEAPNSRGYSDEFLARFGIVRYGSGYRLSRIQDFRGHLQQINRPNQNAFHISDQMYASLQRRSRKLFGVLGSPDYAFPTYLQTQGARIKGSGVPGSGKTLNIIDLEKLTQKRNLFADPEMFFRAAAADDLLDDFSGEGPGDSYFVLGGIPLDCIIESKEAK